MPRLTSNWRKEIEAAWRIQAINDPYAVPSDFLWTTRCSRTKPHCEAGIPRQMYLSPLNIHFYLSMEALGERYGILSDKYGLHMDSETLPSYDIHPAMLNPDEKKHLGLLVRKKIMDAGKSGVIFYNNSPIRSVPYFEMLAYCGLPRVFVTRIPCWRSVYEV